MKRNIKARLDGKNTQDAWNISPQAGATYEDFVFLYAVLKKVTPKDEKYWRRILEVEYE